MAYQPHLPRHMFAMHHCTSVKLGSPCGKYGQRVMQPYYDLSSLASLISDLSKCYKCNVTLCYFSMHMKGFQTPDQAENCHMNSCKVCDRHCVVIMQVVHSLNVKHKLQFKVKYNQFPSLREGCSLSPRT